MSAAFSARLTSSPGLRRATFLNKPPRHAVVHSLPAKTVWDSGSSPLNAEVIGLIAVVLQPCQNASGLGSEAPQSHLAQRPFARQQSDWDYEYRRWQPPADSTIAHAPADTVHQA